MEFGTEIRYPALANQQPSQERHIQVLGADILPLAKQIQQGVDVEHLGGEVIVELPDGRQGQVSQGDVIRDFYDFLADVKIAAEKSGNPKATDIAARVDRFAQETVFVTNEQAAEAIHGFANYHASYLAEDPEKQVLLFVPRNRMEKSQFMVADGILRGVLGTDPELQGRIRIVTEGTNEFAAVLQEGNPDKTRIVLPDDWAVTGNYLANDTSTLVREIRKVVGNGSAYESSIEANLLLARADQLREGGMSYLEKMEGVFGASPITLKAYWRSPSLSSSIYEGPVPTGPWTRVDYGFEVPLREMATFLANERHQSVRMPYMASIVRPYHALD